MKFKCRIRQCGWWTDGSVSSVDLDIYNSAFKLPIVSFIERFQPNQMSEEECIGYVDFLKQEVSTVA